MNTDEGSKANKSAHETRIGNFQRVICEALELDEADIEEFLKEGSKKGKKKKGQVSQRALGRELDVEIGTITKYLRGETDPFNVQTRINKKLASLRKMSLDSLLDFYSTGKLKTDLKADEVFAWVKETSKNDQSKIFELIMEIGTSLNSQTKMIEDGKSIPSIKHLDSEKINKELRDAWKEKTKSNNLSKKENWNALKNEINNSKLIIKSNIEVDSIKDILEGYEEIDCTEIDTYNLIIELIKIIKIFSS